MPQFTGEYDEQGLPIYCAPVYEINDSGTAYIPVAGRPMTDMRLWDVIGRYSAEAVQAERARCVAIVERYTADLQPGPVQIAAREMLAAIGEA